MPDLITVALTGFISFAVSWSTVGLRYWWEGRKGREKWIRDTHSLIDRIQRQILSISTGYPMEDTDDLNSIVANGHFDDIDNWMQELNAKMSNSPENIDSAIYSQGKLTVYSYESFKFGEKIDQRDRRFEDFREALNDFGDILEERTDIYLGSGFTKS